MFGIVSLFADLTYEGARSVSGPFLETLGASGLIVGIVSGLGEMLGYALRLVSGRTADRTRLYWPITLGGYIIQLPAVPALALASGWPVAAVLIVIERIGKAARNPSRDVMLAQAGEHIGRGWAFGLHEAMDQTGALIGPLIIAGILALWPNGYRIAFGVLVIPVCAALAMLIWTRLSFPTAGAVERRQEPTSDFRYPPEFWWYVAGAGLIGFGFADYPLIAYHFTKSGTVGGLWVPVFYAAAMGAGGLGSLAFGKPFDRFGLIVLVPLTLVVAAFAPLVFFGGFALALVGALLWGIGLGVHESVMAAAVATMIPEERRGTAYGVFTAIFGVGWFIGSAVEGGLYDLSIPALVTVAVVAQIAGIFPILRAYSLQRGA
jgi:MFS family permease